LLFPLNLTPSLEFCSFRAKTKTIITNKTVV